MLTQPSKKQKFLLPTEVIMEILLKLPTMSVLRFYCVSKQWFNILRDAYFHSLHSKVLLRSGSPLPSSTRILFSSVQIQHQQPIITFSTFWSSSHHTIRIFSSMDDRDAVSPGALDCVWWPAMHCNGLVGLVPHERLMEQPIIVCNPLTLEYLPLRHCTTSNVFFSSFGLGFAPLPNQHKVVCIHLVKDPSEQPHISAVMEVYTLGDTKWRAVDLHVDFKPWCVQLVGLYADGKIYWVFSFSGTLYNIYSFDVESEKGSVIGLPHIAYDGQGFENKLYDFTLVQMENGVSLFMKCGPVIEVWLLNKYCSTNSKGGNSLWDLRVIISLPCDFVGEKSFRWRVKFVWEFGDEDLIVAFQILSDAEIQKEILFHRTSSTRPRVQFSVDYLPRDLSAWFPCWGYQPNFVSLKRYRCYTGEIVEKVVDDCLESPSTHLPPLME